jgi:hypothetical protein
MLTEKDETLCQRRSQSAHILGPVLFKIFIKDILYFIQESSLYNYADDNTLSYEGHNLDQLITVLERDSLTLIDWFTENQILV